jgi:hypothetical protein
VTRAGACVARCSSIEWISTSLGKGEDNMFDKEVDDEKEISSVNLVHLWSS